MPGIIRNEFVVHAVAAAALGCFARATGWSGNPF
jgi:hypothetical protein